MENLANIADQHSLRGTPELGGRRGSRPRCPLPGGARGAKVPFQFKGLPWRNSELSELNVSAILSRICFRKRKKCSHRASIIAQSPGGEPPRTPIIQYKIENMIRRSSTPDVLQTSLSIYQFKSALSRKTAPLGLAFTSFRRLWSP